MGFERRKKPGSAGQLKWFLKLLVEKGNEVGEEDRRRARIRE